VRNYATLALSFVSAAAVLGNAYATQAKTGTKLADVIEIVRPSVVQVYVTLSSTPTSPNAQVPAKYEPCFHRSFSCIIGTGFFVNSNGDVVTALHVVDGYRGRDGTEFPGAKQIIEELRAAGIAAHTSIGISLPNTDETQVPQSNRIRVYISGVTEGFPVEVIATDPAHDLALIRPNSNPFTNLPKSKSITVLGPGSKDDLPHASAKFVKFSLTRPRDSEDIFACGYPFSERNQVTTSGTLASGWNETVLLRAEAAGFSSPAEVYEVDLRINPGNSGGPVFRLSDQSVIGVAVQSHGSLGYVIPAKFVTGFLTSQGVPWTASKTVSGRPKKP